MAGTTTEASRWNLWYEGVHPVADPTVTVLLRELKERVAGIADNGLSGRGEDVARVDQIRLLEELKAVAAAAQARLTQGLERSQLRQQELAGVSRRDLGRGIGDQVALARRCPSSKGGDHLALARAMVDMPHTLALLTRGELTEWAASLLVAETAILSAEDRRVVDERLCAMSVDARTGEILEPVAPGLTPRQAGGSARALANELDPEAAVKRAAKARRDRRVTIRPTPDTMTYVTGLLPVAQGVAAFAALRASAKASKAAGDHRTEAQIMADLFVERLTGRRARRRCRSRSSW